MINTIDAGFMIYELSLRKRPAIGLLKDIKALDMVDKQYVIGLYGGNTPTVKDDYKIWD